MQTRIVAIGNQKGGVGKTTTSVNLAACLAEKGKRILLVDLDPQANASSGLGMEKTPGRSLYPVLLGEIPLEQQVQQTGIEGLDIVTSEVDLAGAEVDVARSEHYLHRLKEAISPLAQTNRYDYLLIDCPPSLGILTMNAFTAADSILVPLQCEYYALEGLSVISRLVSQLRDSGANTALELGGLVLTMYDMRTNLSRQVVQEVLNHFGDKVYETLIPRSVRLSEAPSFGQAIIQYDPKSAGAACYRQLADEFLKRHEGEAEAPPPPPAPQGLSS